MLPRRACGAVLRCTRRSLSRTFSDMPKNVVYDRTPQVRERTEEPSPVQDTTLTRPSLWEDAAPASKATSSTPDAHRDDLISSSVMKEGEQSSPAVTATGGPLAAKTSASFWNEVMRDEKAGDVLQRTHLVLKRAVFDKYYEQSGMSVLASLPRDKPTPIDPEVDKAVFKLLLARASKNRLLEPRKTALHKRALRSLQRSNGPKLIAPPSEAVMKHTMSTLFNYVYKVHARPAVMRFVRESQELRHRARQALKDLPPAMFVETHPSVSEVWGERTYVPFSAEKASSYMRRLNARRKALSGRSRLNAHQQHRTSRQEEKVVDSLARQGAVGGGPRRRTWKRMRLYASRSPKLIKKQAAEVRDTWKRFVSLESATQTPWSQSILGAKPTDDTPAALPGTQNEQPRALPGDSATSHLPAGSPFQKQLSVRAGNKMPPDHQTLTAASRPSTTALSSRPAAQYSADGALVADPMERGMARRGGGNLDHHELRVRPDRTPTEWFDTPFLESFTRKSKEEAKSAQKAVPAQLGAGKALHEMNKALGALERLVVQMCASPVTRPSKTHWSSLGWCYASVGNVEKALASFEQLQKLNAAPGRGGLRAAAEAGEPDATNMNVLMRAFARCSTMQGYHAADSHLGPVRGALGAVEVFKDLQRGVYRSVPKPVVRRWRQRVPWSAGLVGVLDRKAAGGRPRSWAEKRIEGADAGLSGRTKMVHVPRVSVTFQEEHRPLAPVYLRNARGYKRESSGNDFASLFQPATHESMVQGGQKRRQGGKALVSRTPPAQRATVYSYMALFEALSRAGSFEAVESVYQMALQQSVQYRAVNPDCPNIDWSVPPIILDATFYAELISAHFRNGQAKRAVQMLDDMACFGVPVDHPLFNLLVAQLTECSREWQRTGLVCGSDLSAKVAAQVLARLTAFALRHSTYHSGRHTAIGDEYERVNERVDQAFQRHLRGPADHDMKLYSPAVRNWNRQTVGSWRGWRGEAPDHWSLDKKYKQFRQKDGFEFRRPMRKADRRGFATQSLTPSQSLSEADTDESMEEWLGVLPTVDRMADLSAEIPLSPTAQRQVVGETGLLLDKNFRWTSMAHYEVDSRNSLAGAHTSVHVVKDRNRSPQGANVNRLMDAFGSLGRPDLSLGMYRLLQAGVLHKQDMNSGLLLPNDALPLDMTCAPSPVSLKSLLHALGTQHGGPASWAVGVSELEHALLHGETDAIFASGLPRLLDLRPFSTSNQSRVAFMFAVLPSILRYLDSCARSVDAVVRTHQHKLALRQAQRMGQPRPRAPRTGLLSDKEYKARWERYLPRGGWWVVHGRVVRCPSLKDQRLLPDGARPASHQEVIAVLTPLPSWLRPFADTPGLPPLAEVQLPDRPSHQGREVFRPDGPRSQWSYGDRMRYKSHKAAADREKDSYHAALAKWKATMRNMRLAYERHHVVRYWMHRLHESAGVPVPGQAAKWTDNLTNMSEQDAENAKNLHLLHPKRGVDVSKLVRMHTINPHDLYSVTTGLSPSEQIKAKERRQADLLEVLQEGQSVASAGGSGSGGVNVGVGAGAGAGGTDIMVAGGSDSPQRSSTGGQRTRSLTMLKRSLSEVLPEEWGDRGSHIERSLRNLDGGGSDAKGGWLSRLSPPQLRDLVSFAREQADVEHRRNLGLVSQSYDRKVRRYNRRHGLSPGESAHYFRPQEQQRLLRDRELMNRLFEADVDGWVEELEPGDISMLEQAAKDIVSGDVEEDENGVGLDESGAEDVEFNESYDAGEGRGEDDLSGGGNDSGEGMSLGLFDPTEGLEAQQSQDEEWEQFVDDCVQENEAYFHGSSQVKPGFLDGEKRKGVTRGRQRRQKPVDLSRLPATQGAVLPSEELDVDLAGIGEDDQLQAWLGDDSESGSEEQSDFEFTEEMFESFPNDEMDLSDLSERYDESSEDDSEEVRVSSLVDGVHLATEADQLLASEYSEDEYSEDVEVMSAGDDDEQDLDDEDWHLAGTTDQWAQLSDAFPDLQVRAITKPPAPSRRRSPSLRAGPRQNRAASKPSRRADLVSLRKSGERAESRGPGTRRSRKFDRYSCVFSHRDRIRWLLEEELPCGGLQVMVPKDTDGYLRVRGTGLRDWVKRMYFRQVDDNSPVPSIQDVFSGDGLDLEGSMPSREAHEKKTMYQRHLEGLDELQSRFVSTEHTLAWSGESDEDRGPCARIMPKQRVLAQTRAYLFGTTTPEGSSWQVPSLRAQDTLEHLYRDRAPRFQRKLENVLDADPRVLRGHQKEEPGQALLDAYDDDDEEDVFVGWKQLATPVVERFDPDEEIRRQIKRFPKEKPFDDLL